MNPIDEALMSKQAFFGAVGKAVSGVAAGGAGSSFLQGMGAAAGTGLIAGIGMAAIKIRNSISKKRNFKEMMSLNDDLRAEQSQDPKFFNAAYNSLNRVNPQFGRDPIVAGSYMRKMMANPDAAGLTIAQTVKPLQQKPGGLGVDMTLGPLKYTG